MYHFIYLYIIIGFIFVLHHRDELIHSWLNRDDIYKMIITGLMWLPVLLVQSFYRIRIFIKKQKRLNKKI